MYDNLFDDVYDNPWCIKKPLNYPVKNCYAGCEATLAPAFFSVKEAVRGTRNNVIEAPCVQVDLVELQGYPAATHASCEDDTHQHDRPAQRSAI